MRLFCFEKMQKVKKMFFNREFLLFLLVGVLNTFNGTVFSYLYSFVLVDVQISFTFGYVTSLCVAYCLNSFFVFHQRLQLMKFVRFAISYLPNFLIQSICVYFFYQTLHWPKLITYGLAAVIGIPITFVFMKIFAFQKKK